MSTRERARRRFLARGRALGMPRPLVDRLWSEARDSTVRPEVAYARSATPTRELLAIADGRQSLLGGALWSTPQGYADPLNGGIVSASVDGETWHELGAVRNWTTSPPRTGKRSLLDRLRGR